MKKKFIFPVLCALMMCFVACNENGPTKSMKGKFSVSPTKQVTFSPGNLQYQASTNTWRFAENQYDFIGKDNEKVSDSYDGWIDLFGWGTGDTPTNIIVKDNKNFVDWGINQIGSYAPNTWRTLTRDEWVYLLSRDHTYRTRIERLVETIEGSNLYEFIYGLVLLPDGTELSNDLGYYIVTEITINEKINKWKEFEKIGAVFLPYAGYIYTGHCDVDNGEHIKEELSFHEIYGEEHKNIFYWSSTPGLYDKSAFYIGYDFLEFDNLKEDYICNRLAVRLVKDVE